MEAGKEAEKELREQRHQQKIQDYMLTFESAAGKRVLLHMKTLAKFNITNPPVDTVGRVDPFKMAYREGQKSVITHIELMLQKESRGIKNV